MQTFETVFELVNRLTDDGTIEKLIECGVMSPKIIAYREMVLQYDINLRVKKMSKMKARYSVAVKMNCDLSTVYRAINIMNKKFCKSVQINSQSST